MRLKTAIAGAHASWMEKKAEKNILIITKIPGPMTMPESIAETGAGASEYVSGNQV
jgi:hypothetical protein